MEKFINLVKHHIITISFVFGFLTDSILLPSPDDNLSWIVGLAYIFFIGFLIIYREYVHGVIVKREAASGLVDIKGIRLEKLVLYSTNVITFFSGSLLSFVFIYYFRSSDFIVSLPVLLFIFAGIISNEMIKTQKSRRLLDMMILFICNLFFFIFAVPIFVGGVSSNIFILSVVISVLSFVLYFLLLSYVCKKRIRFYSREITIIIVLLFLVIVLYLSKLLPAVPLSLKSSGIYSSIYRSEDLYMAKEEKKGFIKKIIHRNDFEYNKGDKVYFFSSVHAPTKINTPITHVWEYYDKTESVWVERNRVVFNISGGRESGYRAYSYIENLQEGSWRVKVKTSDDRVVGTYKFTLVSTEDEILREGVDL